MSIQHNQIVDADLHEAKGIASASTGTVLTAVSNVSTWRSAATITWLVEQTTTSGTAFDFTGIPSWAREIHVVLNGCSLSGTDVFHIQLGDSGGIETSNYKGAGLTSAFLAGGGTAVSTYLIYATIQNAGSNDWAYRMSGISSGGIVMASAGFKGLSDTLTQVRVTRSGTNTFDAGSILVGYR